VQLSGHAEFFFFNSHFRSVFLFLYIVFFTDLAVYFFLLDFVRAVVGESLFARPQATFARGSPSSRPDSTPARPTRIRVGVLQNSPGSIDTLCSSRVLLVGCWPDFYLTGERRER